MTYILEGELWLLWVENRLYRCCLEHIAEKSRRKVVVSQNRMVKERWEESLYFINTCTETRTPKRCEI